MCIILKTIMKTPTKKTVRNFSKKNTPAVKNNGTKNQSATGKKTVPVRCELEILQNKLALYGLHERVWVDTWLS